MKVVVNKECSKFWLSPLAMKMLFELKGIKAYFYKSEFKPNVKFAYKMNDEDFNNYNESIFFTVYNKDYGEVLKNPGNKWRNNIKSYFNDLYQFKNREDKDLIKVIETLGEKACLGCKLIVIEIPNNVKDVYVGFDEKRKEVILYDLIE